MPRQYARRGQRAAAPTEPRVSQDTRLGENEDSEEESTETQLRRARFGLPSCRQMSRNYEIMSQNDLQLQTGPRRPIIPVRCALTIDAAVLTKQRDLLARLAAPIMAGRPGAQTDEDLAELEAIARGPHGSVTLDQNCAVSESPCERMLNDSRCERCRIVVQLRMIPLGVNSCHCHADLGCLRGAVLVTT